jgi:hypothetical protein
MMPYPVPAESVIAEPHLGGPAHSWRLAGWLCLIIGILLAAFHVLCLARPTGFDNRRESNDALIMSALAFVGGIGLALAGVSVLRRSMAATITAVVFASLLTLFYLVAGFTVFKGGFGFSPKTLQEISLVTLAVTVFALFALISALLSVRRAKAAGGFMPIMCGAPQPMWGQSPEWADPIYVDAPAGERLPVTTPASGAVDTPASGTGVR